MSHLRRATSVLRRFLDHQAEVVGAWPMSLFRVAYSLVVLAEIWSMWRWRETYFDSWVEWLLPLWVVAVIALLAGAWTRLAAVANFGLGSVVLAAAYPFTYHADVVMLTVNFLLLFIPTAGPLSVDRLGGRANEGVVRFAPNVLLFVAVGLFYFDSVLWKIGSETWRNGLGFWKPASLPQLARVDLGTILDVYPLVLVLGYGILVFEGVFLVLMWFERLRIPLLVVGAALHLGIAIVFPIPLFGLVMVAVLLLLLPSQGLGRQGEIRPLVAVAVFLSAAQVVASLQVSWVPLPDSIRDISAAATSITSRVIGVREHPLFLDQHLTNVPAQRVESNGKLLPFSRADGSPGMWLTGRRYGVWVWGAPRSPEGAGLLIDRFLGGRDVPWVYFQAEIAAPTHWVEGYRGSVDPLEWEVVARG